MNQESYLRMVTDQKESLQNYFTRAKLNELDDGTRRIVNAQMADLDDELRQLSSLERGFDLDKIEKEMPVIPLDKNTDNIKPNSFGFKTSKSQINISKGVQKKIDDEPFLQNQVIAAQEAWNALPDDQRNLVKKLTIKTSSGRNYTGGWFNKSNNELSITLHEIYPNNQKTIFTTMNHEIAHAQYNKMIKEKPDAVKAFNEKVKDIQKRHSINPYVESYRNAYSNNLKKIERYRKDIDREYNRGRITKAEHTKYHKVQDHNEKIAEINHATIFENETHSAIAEYVTGFYPDEIERELDNNKLKELFNAYKELHEY